MAPKAKAVPYQFAEGASTQRKDRRDTRRAIFLRAIGVYVDFYWGYRSLWPFFLELVVFMASFLGAQEK